MTLLADSDCITRQILINADPQRVWDALSDSAKFGAWFHVKLDGPFVVGKATTGNITYPGHEGMPWITVTEVMDPPNHFIFRWPDNSDAQDTEPDTVWITTTFTLQAQNGGTLVTVSEAGFTALPEDRRTAMLRDCAKGWEIQVANLKRYVEG